MFILTMTYYKHTLLCEKCEFVEIYNSIYKMEKEDPALDGCKRCKASLFTNRVKKVETIEKDVKLIFGIETPHPDFKN